MVVFVVSFSSFTKKWNCLIGYYHQGVSCTDLNCCICNLLFSFKKQWNGDIESSPACKLHLFERLCWLFHFLFSCENGMVNSISSTGCKLYLFELLCSLFTYFFHKTMEWWIWHHQQAVSCTSLTCCLLFTSFFHKTMEWWIWIINRL